MIVTMWLRAKRRWFPKAKAQRPIWAHPGCMASGCGCMATQGFLCLKHYLEETMKPSKGVRKMFGCALPEDAWKDVA